VVPCTWDRNPSVSRDESGWVVSYAEVVEQPFRAAMNTTAVRSFRVWIMVFMELLVIHLPKT
jgi:hypothetical protein